MNRRTDRNIWRLMTGHLLVVVIISLALHTSSFAKDPAAQIMPIWKTLADNTEQPFGGEASFIGEPGIAKACSLSVKLNCLKHLDSAATFFVIKSDAYAFEIRPSKFKWDGPIDSGVTKTFVCSFTPTQVGGYTLTFGMNSKPHWLSLASVVLAVNEDGKTIYAGDLRKCEYDRIPPHPQRNSKPLVMTFPLLDSNSTSGGERHFTGTFTFSNSPTVSETTFVDFELTCQFALYSDVQFLLESTTNISPGPLPESWGDKAGLNPDFRNYKGRFSFVPSRPGIGLVNFKVMGKNPVFRVGTRITTEFPIYFVIGEDKKLLFMGSFDPWTRFKNPKDKLLASDTALLGVKSRDINTKQITSKPDYLGEEKQRELDADTVKPKRDTSKVKIKK